MALYAQPNVIVAAIERFVEIENLSIWLLEASRQRPAFTNEQLLSIHRMTSLAKQGMIVCRYNLLFVQEPGKRASEDNFNNLQTELFLVYTNMSHCISSCALEAVYPASTIDFLRDQLYTRVDYDHMLQISVSAYLYYEEFSEACQTAYRLVKSRPDNPFYLQLMELCMDSYRIEEGRTWEPGMLQQELEHLYLDPDSRFHLLQASGNAPPGTIGLTFFARLSEAMREELKGRSNDSTRVYKQDAHALS